MKQLILLMLLWQSYLIPADDIDPSPTDLKNAFSTAVNNNDQDTAVKMFAQFQLLAIADTSYFNPKQEDYLSELSERFTAQITTIFSISDIDACLLDARKQEISLLLEKIKKNRGYIDWVALLGEYDHELSESELALHRIACLSKLKGYYEQEG